jgi:hypothetical protein
MESATMKLCVSQAAGAVMPGMGSASPPLKLAGLLGEARLHHGLAQVGPDLKLPLMTRC